jgi:hypothetical protein
MLSGEVYLMDSDPGYLSILDRLRVSRYLHLYSSLISQSMYAYLRILPYNRQDEVSFSIADVASANLETSETSETGLSVPVSGFSFISYLRGQAGH